MLSKFPCCLFISLFFSLSIFSACPFPQCFFLPICFSFTPLFPFTPGSCLFIHGHLFKHTSHLGSSSHPSIHRHIHLFMAWLEIHSFWSLCLSICLCFFLRPLSSFLSVFLLVPTPACFCISLSLVLPDFSSIPPMSLMLLPTCHLPCAYSPQAVFIHFNISILLHVCSPPIPYCGICFCLCRTFLHLSICIAWFLSPFHMSWDALVCTTSLENLCELKHEMHDFSWASSGTQPTNVIYTPKDYLFVLPVRDGTGRGAARQCTLAPCKATASGGPGGSDQSFHTGWIGCNWWTVL